MKERLVQLEVLRYNPDTDTEAHFQRYEVVCQEEWVVLDALNKVKESIDPTLNYRWSCHMAVCGSCGMMINGEPKLSCHAFLRDYDGVIRVEPLTHFPVERDLVTAPDDFMEKLKRVKPYVIPKEAKPIEEGEYKQTPAQLMKFRQYSMCINCMLCYAACPEYGLTPQLHRPGGPDPGPPLQPGFARRGARSAWKSSPPKKASGSAPSSAPVPKSARPTSIRPAPAAD
jgi:fumarate reductase iron-sulfur subunit